MPPVQRNEPSMLEKTFGIFVMLLDAVLDFPNLAVMLWHAIFTMPVIMVVLYMRLISTSMDSIIYKTSPKFLHPKVMGAIGIMDNLIGFHILATFYAYLRFPNILTEGVNLYDSSLFCHLIKLLEILQFLPNLPKVLWNAFFSAEAVKLIIIIRATIDALRIIDWLVLPIVTLPLNEVMLYMDLFTIIYFLILFMSVI